MWWKFPQKCFFLCGKFGKLFLEKKEFLATYLLEKLGFKKLFK
jgi:hypothetical protein